MIRCFLIFLLFFNFQHLTVLSNNIDSLKNILLHTTDDSLRLNLYKDIAFELFKCNLAESEEYLLLLNELANKVNNQYYISFSNTSLGVLKSTNRDRLNALKYLKLGLEVAEEIKNPELIAYASKGLTSFYNNAGNPEKGKQYGQRGLNIIIELENSKDSVDLSREKILLLAHLGASYVKLGEFEKAVLNIDKAIRLSELKNLHEAHCTSLITLGKLYEKQDKMNSALEAYKKAFNIYKGNYSYMLSCLDGIMRMYDHENNRDSLKYYAEITIDLTSNKKAGLQLPRAYRYLSEIAASENKYKEAFELHTVYHAFNDSQAKLKNNEALIRVEEEYKFNNALNLVESERRIKFFQTVIAVSFLFLVLLLFIILFINQKLRHNRSILEKEKLQKNLLNKSQKLTSNAMHSIKSKEVHEKVIRLLSKVKNKVDSDSKKDIKLIIKTLEESENEDTWKEFEVYFSNVYPDFYKNLATDFPDLTLNEKKICAFTKMKMNSKEISNFSNARVNTVTVAKTRIKKKLGITNTNQTLEQFLEKY